MSRCCLARVWLLVLTCGAVVLTACSSSSSTVTSPSTARCPVELVLSPATLDASGGAGQVAVTVARECAWEARSEASWITFTGPTAGQGEATLRFAAAANPLVTSRRGALVVNEQRIDVTQSASVCRFELSSAAGSVGAGGGSLAVSVTAQPSCRWSATSEADWIRVEAGRDGEGSGGVELSVSPNPGPARQGSVLIAGVRYAVAQQANGTAPGPPTPLPPPGCAYTLSPNNAAFAAAGGEVTIAVQASTPSCSWTAVATAPWITVNTASSIGSGSTQLVVGANAGAERSGAVIIAGLSVAVTQAAAPPPNCEFTVAPRAADVAHAGGEGMVSVRTATASCSWSATSNASWIAVTPRSSTGNGDVRYTVAANGGAARTGTFSVAGVVVTIAQAAAPAPACEYDISPRSESFTAEGGGATIRIRTSGSSCSWTAATSASWISLAGGSGNGDADLRFTVAANQGAARNGTITVRGVTISVSQAAAAPPGPCEYDVSPRNDSFGANGGEAAIRVRPSAGSCSWTATSNVSWLAVTSGSGSGSGEVRYTVAANTGGARSGTITVGGVAVAITQQAAPAPPTCDYDVSPRNESVGVSGGGGTIRVRAASSCAWTAGSNASWIGLASGSGTGDADLRYTVDPNSGGARTGVVTVAGIAVTITQAAAAPASIELRGEVSAMSGSCPNLSFVLDGRQVRTSGSTDFQRNDCDWFRNGRDARVTGLVQPDGTVLALRLRRGDD